VYAKGDIVINNLMMYEDDDNPSWPSYLIDLDLAVKEQRDKPSGARGKTGTRAFMAIGVLLDEKLSFMHESRVHSWCCSGMCIHYNGLNKERVVPQFDK
jgi:hypothetical protein